MATFLAAALLSPIGAQQSPHAAQEVHCDLSINKWEAQSLLPITAPVMMQGRKFSSILVFRNSAAVLLYDSVDASKGRRHVTVYVPNLEQVLSFDASHVYVDLPDYEPPDGWMVLGIEFIDADQNQVKKFSFAHRHKADGQGFEILAKPVESFSSRCVR